MGLQEDESRHSGRHQSLDQELGTIKTHFFPHVVSVEESSDTLPAMVSPQYLPLNPLPLMDIVMSIATGDVIADCV